MAPHFPWYKSSNPSIWVQKLSDSTLPTLPTPPYPTLACSVSALVDSSLSLAYMRNIPSGSIHSHSFNQLFPDVWSSPSVSILLVSSREGQFWPPYIKICLHPPEPTTLPRKSVLHPSYSIFLHSTCSAFFFLTFFSQVSLVVKSPLPIQETRWGFDPWARKIPWRRAWQPTPVFSSGKSHGQRSLVGYSPGVRKESDTTEQLTLWLWWCITFTSLLIIYLPLQM